MKSNTEWIKWGKYDPLYAVASWRGKEKDGNAPWKDEEFYELGRSDWEDFLAQWKQYGVDAAHVVEIGCGAGRLTEPMCDFFDKVTAVDVSEDQIAYAEKRIRAGNIDFRVTDGTTIPLENGSASAVFSTHVFQHFDSVQDAVGVFAEIRRVLKPGGSVMIHMPIYRLPHYPVRRLLEPVIDIWKILGTLKAGAVRRAGGLTMRNLQYRREDLERILDEMDFAESEFRSFPVASNRCWHDFLLARR